MVTCDSMVVSMDDNKRKQLSFGIERILELDSTESKEKKTDENNCLVETPSAFVAVSKPILNENSTSENSRLPINSSWNAAFEMQRRLFHERIISGRRVGHPYQSRAIPKHKKPRTSFTKNQVAELETRFRTQKYLASAERATLAKSLQMSDSQVKTWFQNRRTKWRRQATEEKEEERKTNLRLYGGSLTEFSSTPAYFARPDVAI